MLLWPVEMRFNYQDSFAVPSPDAYEKLLWDVINNDPTLFMRADQVEAAWQILMPALEVWAESNPRNFPNYATGSPGDPQGRTFAHHADAWAFHTHARGIHRSASGTWRDSRRGCADGAAVPAQPTNIGKFTKQF